LSLFYADTSALARAYLDDEPDHATLGHLLLESGEQVVTSELSRLELASTVRSAERAGRVFDGEDLLTRIASDVSELGAIQLLKLRPERTLPAAHRLLLTHRLRTLDAIHLAVALDDARTYAGSEEVVLVTRDADQAAAARALGLAVR